MTDNTVTDLDRAMLDKFEEDLRRVIEKHITRIANVQNGGKPPQYSPTGETVIIFSALCAVLARRVKAKGGRPDELTSLLFVLEGMLFFSRDRMRAIADQYRQQPQRPQKPKLIMPGDA